jgi:hypothetical protein
MTAGKPHFVDIGGLISTFCVFRFECFQPPFVKVVVVAVVIVIPHDFFCLRSFAQLGFFGCWAIPQVGFELGPSLVERNSVAERTDRGVGRCEWKPTVKQSHGVDGVPIASGKGKSESFREKE